VVVVGGSFAGMAVVLELLDSFNVVLIDRKAYLEYVALATRAVAQNDFLDKLCIPYQEIVQAYGDRFKFI